MFPAPTLRNGRLMASLQCMVIQPDLFEEVVKLRALARRARRLGKQLLNEKDKDRLEQFALELERDAARLETEALRK